MKRILVTLLMGLVVLSVGAASGLGTFWLLASTALAGGFGWMLGGLPSGASTEHQAGAGGDGGSGGDGGGGGE